MRKAGHFLGSGARHGGQRVTAGTDRWKQRRRDVGVVNHAVTDLGHSGLQKVRPPSPPPHKHKHTNTPRWPGTRKRAPPQPAAPGGPWAPHSSTRRSCPLQGWQGMGAVTNTRRFGQLSIRCALEWPPPGKGGYSLQKFRHWLSLFPGSGAAQRARKGRVCKKRTDGQSSVRSRISYTYCHMPAMTAM